MKSGLRVGMSEIPVRGWIIHETVGLVIVNARGIPGWRGICIRAWNSFRMFIKRRLAE